MNINPFNVIKSSNLGDKAIVDYWVDILNSQTHQESYQKLLSPESPGPMFLLGGKGSGKTHILRYYSFGAQKMRAQNKGISILEKIQHDKFLSVYLELGNFGFRRFSGSNIDQGTWDEWYFYYLNLLLTELYLENIIDLIHASNDLGELDLDLLRSSLSDIFFDHIEKEVNCIEDIYIIIKKSRKQLDKKISRIKTGIDSKFSDMDLLFDTRENRFFDIVHITKSSYAELDNVRILFLIDQFEDLSKSQQVFINTLIRHPRHPDTLSLRVSGRLYAIKTKDTYSDDEKVLDAEGRTKILESFMAPDHQSKKTHEEFSINMCKSRVELETGQELSNQKIKESFGQNDFQAIKAKIIRKHPCSVERNYFVNLAKKLERFTNLEKETINEIIENLACSEEPLFEKKNIYLLYQAWSKNKDLLSASLDIKQSLFLYLSKSDSKRILHTKSTLEHVESDLLYQLLKEYNQPIIYCGFQTVLNMTQSNPRGFLNIMKHLYEHSDFANEQVFSSVPVSCKVQNRAIREVSEWFWQDATSDIEDINTIKFIERLCEYFRAIRASEKPSEKTLISFSYNERSSTKEVKSIIKTAKNHSLIIEDTSGKKSKNSKGIILKKYQINPMLSAKWDLSIEVGGTIEFTNNDILSLCQNNDDLWNKLKNEKLSKLSPPFSSKNKNKKSVRSKIEQQTMLFED